MTTQKQKKATHNGFTLVELLVVISIVGVLMSILLPTLSEARFKAREVQCQANLKFLVLGSIAYSHDFKGQVPDGGYSTYGRGCFDTDTRKALFDTYGLGNVKLWWCPLAYFVKNSAVTKSFNSGQNVKWFNDPTWDPGVHWTENHRNQQGYNYFIGTGRAVSGTIYNMPGYTRFDTVRAPSTRLVWADNIKSPGTQAGGVSGVWQHPCNTHDRMYMGEPDGAFNAMVDGHVEYRRYFWGTNTHNWLYQYFIY